MDRRDETTDARRTTPRFIATLAEDHETVLAAQRLRHRVFRTTCGMAPSDPDGVDRDPFDEYCEHLVVRDRASGEVVGTYRILTAVGAARAGGFYSETEFDLERLRRLDARLVEVGRACVDPAYRHGGVITALLAGLTRWLVAERCDYVIGCASVEVAVGSVALAGVCGRLIPAHLGPEAWRTFPRVPYEAGDHPAGAADLPPLIKTYLRLGASVCGAPALDEAFGTVDFLMMLPMATMAPRFRARVLRDGDGVSAGRPTRPRWAA